MLENIDLSVKVSKQEFKKSRAELELKLGELQRTARALRIPVVVVFEGWDAAGKGRLINQLILPLDPRGFTVHSAGHPTEEETLRPFLWRFWISTPPRGRITVFDRSWYRRALQDRVEEKLKAAEIERAFQDIRAFERQLADDGAAILKFFLHITKKEQKARFKKFRRRRTTAWRVTEEDLRRHKRYGEYLAATEDMLAETDTDFAPWTIVEAHDYRFATLKIFRSIIICLETRVRLAGQKAKLRSRRSTRPQADAGLTPSFLDKVDLSLSLERDAYRDKLRRRQKRLRDLQFEIYLRRIPVVIAYEGWDAAGKGGNLRRLTQNLDPRGYEVVPIGAPNDVEKSHHHLWRFWGEMPKAGHITIFDRSWYGRVLVERVERLCTQEEWRRAYREINEMEEHLTGFGMLLLKFWLHTDKKEQLRRFRERERLSHKNWKITEEDWRNRRKWDDHKKAVEEMLLRTSTPCAPWTIVESNCKLYARIKVLDTVISSIQRRLRAR